MISTYIGTKLDEVIHYGGFKPLMEAKSRMRPARILTARGVVIEADHARMVTHPDTGTKILVMGITNSRDRQAHYISYNSMGQAHCLTRLMRDFCNPGAYEPGYKCDETGWCEPDEDGRYDAHRDYVVHYKFNCILTAYADNIQDIKWL